MENTITRYLQDAVAAEKSFETQLRGFADEATNTGAKTAFATHAEETRQQYVALTNRLTTLGASPSTLKSAMAHLFNMAPKIGQIGHSADERTTQDLIMAYSVENAEVAMYESLIIAAEAAGDAETAALGRHIQSQEKATAGRVWGLIAPSASAAYRKLDADKRRSAIVRYLEDTEAAERNFEDALAGFSKVGDQPEVQALFSKMSSTARTQHERLETRLRALGGSPSTAKSFLAHMLTLTPLSGQLGHTEAEKSTQNLMITFAAASAEMAMYESLASSAEVAGDETTAQLARQLQKEEKEDHSQAWDYLVRSARRSSTQVMKQTS